MRQPSARRVLVLAAVLGLCACVAAGCGPRKGGKRRTLPDPQPPRAEFRGIFVATAYNLDWPSKPSLHRRVQRDEIAATVAHARELNCNVIMLQVRAFGDRIYRDTSLAADSNGKYEDEPWAQSLAYGNDPDPNESYDPLSEWIGQCRAAGIELHAWVNPFRVNRLVKVKQGEKWHYLPVMKWEKQLWLQPNSKAVQDYVRAVLDDLLKHYRPAVDGPAYRMVGDDARMLMAMSMMADDDGPDGILYDHYWPEAPDEEPPTTQPSSLGRPAPGAGGRAAMVSNSAIVKTSAERRVDWLMKLYNAPDAPRLPDDTTVPLEKFLDDSFDKVKAADGKFGLSPNPDDGLVEKQLSEGQVDYVIPELYEPGAGGYDFTEKLEQWLSAIPADTQNPPIVVAGLHTVRVQRPEDPVDEPVSADVILKQMEAVRQAAGEGGQRAAGEAHYSAGALRYPEHAGPAGGAGGERNLGKKLKGGAYKAPRLAPRARRSSGSRPNEPQVWTETDAGQRWARWKAGTGNGRNPRRWLVWSHNGVDWSAPRSFGRKETELKIDASTAAVAVQAVDKYNRTSDIGSTP